MEKPLAVDKSDCQALIQSYKDTGMKKIFAAMFNQRTDPHYKTLKKFISLPPSINEVDLKLEQLRALDAKMTIGVSYVKDVPISVDTKEDLIIVENIIKSKL